MKRREVEAMLWESVSRRMIIDRALPHLTPMQLRATALLFTEREAPTYSEVASKLCVSQGTLHTHLRIIRQRHPEFYALIMERRREQLARRHAAAVERQEARSRQWHRRQGFLRYREAHGRYPWEP